MLFHDNVFNLEKIIKNIQSSTDIVATLKQNDMSRATYYRLLKRYREQGLRGLVPKSRKPKKSPNRTPVQITRKLYRYAKDDRYLSAKQIHRKLIDSGNTLSYSTVIKLLRSHHPPLYGKVVCWKPL